MKALRIASVIASKTAGGIGPVCQYAAEIIAEKTNWTVTLVILHDIPSIYESTNPRFRIVALGLENNCSERFLDWLRLNPQDVIITSGVQHIEKAFQFFPPSTRHIVQIHDCLKRYFTPALENSKFIDGVICVARHIEDSLRIALKKVGFRGLLETVHNGATFPAPVIRTLHDDPLKLLYMGRLDPFKGIYDLPKILRYLRRLNVPVSLAIIGGTDKELVKDFARLHVAESVTWVGVVPHEECYSRAAESDLLLLPSRKEPFGMVTIEAMAMGCVPMGYDATSGTIEIIEPEQSGILIPLGDLRGWAGRIGEINKDRLHLLELSRAASLRARSEFSSLRMAENLMHFITKVVRNSERYPSERKTGSLSMESVTLTPRRSGYQKIPAKTREFIRRLIGRNPRLCRMFLDHL